MNTPQWGMTSITDDECLSDDRAHLLTRHGLAADCLPRDQAVAAIVEAVSAVDVYRPILEDAVREMEAQGLSVAATYREWLSDPAGFRPYAETARALRALSEDDKLEVRG